MGKKMEKWILKRVHMLCFDVRILAESVTR